MTTAPHHPLESGPIPGTVSGWASLVTRIQASLLQHALAPDRLLVLLPYAQLIEPARRAWAQEHPDGFSPRFETSRNWASAMAPWAPSPSDLSGDVARDRLMAEALVDRVVRSQRDTALRAELVARLTEAARQLAPLAAAVPPAQRAAWAQARQEALSAAPQWESVVSSLALAWVGNSGFPTDVLWASQAAPGVAADRLWLLEGFQDDPLGRALAERWGERAEVARLAVWLGEDGVSSSSAVLRVQACADTDEEARGAAARVICQVNAGAVPLALVANDRLLTRRISAMLQNAGLGLRDETGWKLSTTRAAAQLMSLLRAADPRARSDDVIDLLKQGAAWPADVVEALEMAMREQGLSAWRSVTAHPATVALLPDGLIGMLEGLHGARPLERWLDDLRAALSTCGLWTALCADPAGRQLIRVLRLDEGAGAELRQVGQALAGEGNRAASRIGLSPFTAWVRDVLESASFLPPGDADAPVVILPMAQLLGRGFVAAVVPGCDEVTLDPNPEPAGAWTAGQRSALGLPSREQLSQAAAGAWRAVLAVPQLDIFWRRQEGGEPLAASPLVLALEEFCPDLEVDASGLRPLSPKVALPPQPVAPDLLPSALSASAYQDLRDCPYRFFGLRQLRLAEPAELEVGPDQRDLGNWLHEVLKRFHEARQAARPGRDVDTGQLDRIGEAVAADMGLQTDEGDAGFLPYQAVWPALRDGYLDWLYGYEGQQDRPGPLFGQAEVELSASLPPWRLWGKLDRIDHQSSPEGRLPVVIDYKTESRQSTRERVKAPLEDTQLAFYAALLPDDNLRAAYLSITDGRAATASEGATQLFEQTQVLLARQRLREGLAHDLARIAEGQPLPALGEGSVCEFCAARGLCRKDFWGAM